MAKLSNLKLTPEMKAERAEIERQRRERIAAILADVKALPQSPTRSDLHTLLDACLDLKALDEGGARALPNPDSMAKQAARFAGRTLLRHALGWTEPDAPSVWEASSPAAVWFYLEATPELLRAEAASILERSPNLLPPVLLDSLIGGLRALNEGSGDMPWLLTPFREQGGGANPTMKRRMEEAAWRWIARQKGAGRPIADAVAEVASEVGRTTKAVEKWKEAWEKREAGLADGDRKAGKAAVKRELDSERGLGATQGANPPGAMPLQVIARHWLAAVAAKNRAEKNLSSATDD